jgi:transglutaminase-like putative cysteine protease
MEQQIEKSLDYKNYLKASDILDFDNSAIKSLIKDKGWNRMTEAYKVKSIYNYVKDDIKFGYNLNDNIPASEVLKDGFGQCNTKANLYMALLRAVGIPNRMHGFTIYKALQKGAITGIWYKLSPFI